MNCAEFEKFLNTEIGALDISTLNCLLDFANTQSLYSFAVKSNMFAMNVSGIDLALCLKDFTERHGMWTVKNVENMLHLSKLDTEVVYDGGGFTARSVSLFEPDDGQEYDPVELRTNSQE